MGLSYENLDSITRQRMLDEVRLDLENDNLYISTHLNEEGKRKYPALLQQAIETHDDNWLAQELRAHGCMSASEMYKKRGGGVSHRRVPRTAAVTLAEGEFNRFYVRGLCLRGIEESIDEVEVYRGKIVQSPRKESQIKIGMHISTIALLEDLRNSPGVEPALGLPPGPNSGLTVRFPKQN